MTWLIVVVVVVVIVALGAVVVTRQRSRALQGRFGPEYDRLVEEDGDRRKAEAELRERAKRRDALEIRELDPDVLQAYAEEWREVQGGFIDEPERTVAEADVLVQRVMRDRGYPVDELDERIEMVSVDHPELAENYRVAHAVQLRSEEDGASTDELRTAFQRYRSLFTELLADGLPAVDDDNDKTHETDDLPERGV
jgi:hypothetical protein